MAKIGGPNGGDKVPGAQPGAKILPFRETRPATHVESPEKKGETVKSDASSTFDPTASKEVLRPLDQSGEVRGAGVKARLTALGVRGAEGHLPIKSSASRDIGRVKETPIGKIIEGSVTVESPEGLKKLEGVVRVAGDLVVQESAAKSVDFLALKSLVEVGGRLIIEGNGAVSALDALENLERARGLYIGFNSGLQKVSLPRLQELDAALIIEGNSALTEVSLPAFRKGTLYVHVHDNAALTSVSLPALQKLGEELSFIDNPNLASVKVGAAQKPAVIGSVELVNNGAVTFPTLFSSAHA